MLHWQMMPSKISLNFYLVTWYQSSNRGKICPSCVNRTGFGETLLLLFPCWWVLFHFGIYGGAHFKEQNAPDLCSWKGNSSYYNSGADHAQILSRSDLASFFLVFAAHWVHLLCFKIRSDLKICQPGASGHLIRTDPKTPVCGINCWVLLELVFLEVNTKYLIIYHNGDFYIFLWIFLCFRKRFFSGQFSLAPPQSLDSEFFSGISSSRTYLTHRYYSWIWSEHTLIYNQIWRFQYL